MFNEEIQFNVVVIEHGKFIMIKYLCKETGDIFWSFPSSKIKDQINLKIHLLPYRLELPDTDQQITSQKNVTFIAYPEGGDINITPYIETEIDEQLAVVDFRWQEINEDMNLGILEQKILHSVREYLENGTFSHRVGTLIYKIENEQVEFLLLLKNKRKEIYTLPQGALLKNEFPESGAKRKGVEQTAVESKVEKKLGFYLLENKNKLIYTDIYLANFIAEIPTVKRINKKWCTVEEIENLNLSREAKRCIFEVYPELKEKTAASIPDAERVIIQKFHDRKHKRNMALALMLIGAIVLSIGLSFKNLYVGTILLVMGITLDRMIWRCPVCNHHLPNDGISENVKYCYHCSTRLQ